MDSMKKNHRRIVARVYDTIHFTLWLPNGKCDVAEEKIKHARGRLRANE